MPAGIGDGSPINALDHNRYTDAWRALGEPAWRSAMARPANQPGARPPPVAPRHSGQSARC